ncbi:MAG: group 1 glycosyl transferase [Candidatus Peregrinibacteria bacterium Greene0416_62]|nr:MAG: group 1 glycosyl transferase [Candidatus Peregrinibacteria bacterium Greene0416_62]TSC96665.1 MAG: group 1 glycosyl transferase [Candidatus Peregrinibacteria bacterium Greene1014_49]
MRIAYVTQTRFPTERAHGYQVAQVCHAVASLDHEVTLVTPTVGAVPVESAFSFYGISENFRIERLQQFDALSSPFVPGQCAFAIAMLSYRFALKKFFETCTPDLLYIRTPILLPVLLDTKIPVILELHTLPKFFKRRFVRMANRCRLVICLTKAMRDELLSWGCDPRRMLVEGDGVDHERFYNLPEARLAAQDWALPTDRTVVGYVGSLVTRDTLEKGVAELIDAVALLRKKGSPVFCWIVGGPSSWLGTYKRRAEERGLTVKDIRFQGAIPVRRVPSAIAACDVCVYPAPKSRHPYFLRDTSPLKLFEYLAARKPIVCADLPPIRDIVSDRIVHFCVPGDAESLAQAIMQAIEHPLHHPEERADIVHRHSWVQRMERILAEAV